MRKLSVKTGMSRPPKPVPQAKRVAPPAVPDVYRHSGSSFGSASYISAENAGYMAPPDTPSALRIRDDHSDYGNTILKSPSVLNNFMIQSKASTSATAFPFPCSVQLGEQLTHKTAVFYHQQLALQEDQGIDLTQSPGRDSPGSSSDSAGSGSRHSTASLDSGRASSYLTGASNRGTLSSPRCSVSSCSIGSVDRMTQKTDYEIILDWLTELRFDDYTHLFIAAGYDLPTIARMTPEDLTAIGIKKPNHRERIKQHIDLLQLSDSLPNYVPGSIEEWLRLLRLEEYIQPLLAQGYQTVRDVTQLTWEDLEEIGIVKLGHQKKILLAIKRIKDIISGKWVSPGLGGQCLQQKQQISEIGFTSQISQTQHQQPQFFPYHHLPRQQLLMLQQQQQLILEQQQYMKIGFDHDDQLMTQSSYYPEKEANDIVVIQLRQTRGKSLESLEDSCKRVTSTHLTFNRAPDGFFPQGLPVCGDLQSRNNSACADGEGCVESSSGHTQYSGANLQHIPWRRSYDDGDITPTNETAINCSEQRGGGTLPRNGRNLTRARPIAKVTANIIMTSSQTQQQQQYMLNNRSMKIYSSKPSGIQFTSPLLNKKEPPELHGRQCTIDLMEADFENLTLAQQQYIISHQNQLHQIHQQQHLHVQSNMPEQHGKHPLYSNYPGQHQTTVEIHAEKTHDSKSDFSIDSIDAIPFANENAGTIKQRSINRQDLTSSSLSSSSSSSSSSSTNTVAHIQQMSTQSTLNDLSSQSIIVGGGTSPNLSTSPISCLDSNNLSLQNDVIPISTASSHIINCGVNNVDLPKTSYSNTTNEQLVDANVLNDIGNMLANLTDELDAMLEEEKRAGLNDSE